nr:uncharacterized protein LOC113692281 isoform X3 [Coffea arabica]
MGKLSFGRVLDRFCLSSSRSGSCLCINNYASEDERELESKPLITTPETGQLVKIKDVISAPPTLALQLKPQTVVLKVSMHCNGCARKVKKHISKMEADLAMNKLASATLHGRPIQMMDCHPCTKMTGLVPDTLFVRNLPDWADIELLEFLFFKYGKIWYINIPRRPDGQSADYGFVQFDSDEPCRAAIEEMNGYEALGVSLRVDPYYLDPEKKIFGLDSAKPCDGYSQDAADVVCAVRNVLAQQINTGASKAASCSKREKVKKMEHGRNHFKEIRRRVELEGSK